VLETKAAERVRILVVDDDDDVRNVAAALVEEIGYDVDAADSGEAALRLLAADRFALVITDLAMPGMTGVDLARQIRSNTPDLPIIFTSGYADVQTFGEELLEETMLKKPCRIAELAARISGALADRLNGRNVVSFRG
jgi:CheY-like chemotaxis protein